MKRGWIVGAAVLGAILGFRAIRAVEDAREAARRSQCVGNLKWIAIALLNYESASGTFPPGTVPNPALPPERRLSWIIPDWPWITGGGAVFDVDGSRGWDESPNWPPKFVAAPNATFVDMKPEDTMRWVACPDDPAEGRHVRPLPLTYVGIAGVGADAQSLPAKHPRAGVFGYDRVTRTADITDGAGQTMMVVETSVGTKSWTAGGPSSVRGIDPATRPYLGPGRPFGGYHPGGANAAFADGSVRFIRDTIAPNVFEALSTVAGGESLPAEWVR